MNNRSVHIQKFDLRPVYYDARPFTDLIKFEMTTDDGVKEKVSFPVTIRRPRMPILTYREGDSFSDMVTIVTKTFMRYDCLKNLLDSLNIFYPDVKVIIADDTPDDLYQTFNITQVRGRPEELFP